MSQPAPYAITTDFSQEEASGVAGRSTVRTSALDAEFANLSTTITQLLANLQLLQRDDGGLRDLVVAPYSLSAATLALIGSAGFTVANPSGWLTATAYPARQIVVSGTGTYVCAVAHTSGTFATDLAAGKWVTLFDSSAYVASGVAFTPTGTIAATNVQSAIAEVATESQNYTAPLVGGASRTINSKLREIVTPADFLAAGDGVTDDLIPLNKFFAACALGAPGDMGGPDKIYAISAALDQVVGHDITIHGSGFILYTGAGTTPGNLLTFGDGSTLYQRLDLRGWGIGSSTTLAGGFALRVRKYTGVELDLDLNGTIANPGKLYNGVTFPTSSIINLHSTRVHVRNTGVHWTDGVELHCNHAYVSGSIGTLGVNDGSGTGIYISGGCGGFYSENLTQLFNNIGCLIDTAGSASGNNQFFFGPHSTFDNNGVAGLYVDDAVSNPTGKIIRLDAWFASCTNTGNGVSIVNFADGTIVAGTATITNNDSSGFSCSDQTTKVTLGSGTKIYGNGAYGVFSDAAQAMFCSADVRGNTTANFHPNVYPIAPKPAATILGQSGAAVSCPADTTEDVLATITVPANTMGIGGTLRVRANFTITNGADDKTVRIRFSSISGTVFAEKLETAVASVSLEAIITNRTTAALQVGRGFYQDTAGGALTTAATASVDTTAATTVVITGQKETSGNTLTLESYCVELLPA